CLSSPLLLYSPRALRDLHPFPTRRSSDLGAVRARRSPHRRGLRGRGPACATEALNMRSSRVRSAAPRSAATRGSRPPGRTRAPRSEEHTSELQSPYDLVCRLLLEKKKEQR